MTETAEIADIVMPATMFVEHDDIYRGRRPEPYPARPEAGRAAANGAHQSLRHRGTGQTPRRRRSPRLRLHRARNSRPHPANRAACRITTISSNTNGSIASPISRTAHYLNGFAHPDGKFHFRPDWINQPAPNKPPEAIGALGPACRASGFPGSGRCHRSRRSRASLPPRHVAGAQLPEFELLRDQDLPPEGRPP